jgi:hypothetical protein
MGKPQTPPLPLWLIGFRNETLKPNFYHILLPHLHPCVVIAHLLDCVRIAYKEPRKTAIIASTNVRSSCSDSLIYWYSLYSGPSLLSYRRPSAA